MRNWPRNDNVAKKVHWDLYKKNGLGCTEKWCEQVPEGAVENEEVKLLWKIAFRCDNVIEARKPDIIVVDKKKHKRIPIDVAVRYLSICCQDNKLFPKLSYA